MAPVPAARRTRPAVATSINLVTEEVCLRIPAAAWTLTGFRDWIKSDDFPEKTVRPTFVGGEIILDMSREELETHVSVKVEVTRVLANLNRELKLGKLYYDGAQIANEAADLSNQPDGVFLSRDSLRSGRIRLVPREGEQGQYTEIEGTPDWVLEVVSKSSVGKDTKKLREAYHKAGIAEYWLIDARREEIVFQILYWRKRGYVAAPERDGWQDSKVFGRSFRLERQRDEFGLWEYTLQVR